jgi:TldD protein
MGDFLFELIFAPVADWIFESIAGKLAEIRIVSRLLDVFYKPLSLVAAVLALAAFCGVASAKTHVPEAGHGAPAVVATTDNDPLLVAMQQELAREKELLVLPGMQRPYFMEYRLEDLKSYEAVANYGALTREQDSHQRVVRVTVRIGDYATDSSSARGDGSLQLAPNDNDADALKYALWTATDEAYKNALRAYATKQATLKRFQTPPTADDFTPAKAVTNVEPLATLELDRADWKKRLVEASGLYSNAPEAKSFAADVQYSSANVRGFVVNRYTVNTDGAVLRHGYSGYAANIAVGGQAPDGMQLGRENGTTSATAAGLESWPKFKQRTLDNLKSFDELRHAPVVDAEDYHGPVLFSGDAAADVINRLFVPNIEADRPEIGTTARTQGAFQSSFRSKVLPEFISVVDDPSLRMFEGQSLLGSFAVDDEGVPAQEVTIVDKGKLENYLVGREPVKDFPASNGHGRAAPGAAPHSRAGVIVVKSDAPVPAAQLRAKLLEMAKEQGRDVYEVETLGGELAPRMLYRVSADGKRTLVRGAVFDELDQRSLRSEIMAAGDDPYINQTIAPVPETTIVPSLLFADIAVKRATDEQGKLPYYAPPAVK